VATLVELVPVQGDTHPLSFVQPVVELVPEIMEDKKQQHLIYNSIYSHGSGSPSQPTLFSRDVHNFKKRGRPHKKSKRRPKAIGSRRKGDAVNVSRVLFRD